MSRRTVCEAGSLIGSGCQIRSNYCLAMTGSVKGYFSESRSRIVPTWVFVYVVTLWEELKTLVNQIRNLEYQRAVKIPNGRMVSRMISPDHMKIAGVAQPGSS